MNRSLLTLAAALVTMAGCSALIGVDKDYVEGAADSAAGTPDGTTADDATAEAAGDATATQDAGDAAVALETGTDAGCAGHVCQGVCLAGTSCASCAAGSLFCTTSHTCVSTCAACQVSTTECWSCSGAQPAGSCEPTATAFCFSAGYTHCPCAGDAGEALCPGATHTCKSGQCTTCGEPGTDGSKCKSGLDCQSSNSTCH